jgi:hypothetical protein
MKNLLRLKQADLILQIAALIPPAIYCWTTGALDAFATAYITVGFADAISVLVNLGLPKRYRHPFRPAAIWLLLGIEACVCSLFFLGWGIGELILIAILFLGPIVAIWYGFITWYEMRAIGREAEHLQETET